MLLHFHLLRDRLLQKFFQIPTGLKFDSLISKISYENVDFCCAVTCGENPLTPLSVFSHHLISKMYKILNKIIGDRFVKIYVLAKISV